MPSRKIVPLDATITLDDGAVHPLRTASTTDSPRGTQPLVEVSVRSRVAPKQPSDSRFLAFGRNPKCPRDFLYHPLSGTMEYTTKWGEKSVLIAFVDAVLRGLGQVGFINNPVMGIFVLVAAFLNNVFGALMGLLGIFMSTLTAEIFLFPKDAIQAGIFGYNGYLIGTAIVVLSADYAGTWNYLLLAPVVVCAALSSFVTLALGNALSNVAGKASGVFTYPFHIMTWIWLLGAQRYRYFPTTIVPALTSITTVADRALQPYSYSRLVEYIVVGVGQIFFFDTLPASIVSLAGYFVASRIAGIAAFTGASVGVLVAIAVGAPVSELGPGLWGYDAALACIAVGGMFFRLSPRAAALALIAALCATLMHGALSSLLAPVGLPPLTFGAASTLLFDPRYVGSPPSCSVDSLLTSVGGKLKAVYVMPLADVRIGEENFA